MVVKINIKWQKKLLQDVEVDLAESPEVFKSQLWTLTGVPPDRQKILGLKGGQLKDDTDWAATGLKDGMTVMMMGSAGPLPTAPESKTLFVEDLGFDPDQTNAMTLTGIADTSCGLQNLGETCYMNATVQCLNAVPELRTRLSTAHQITANTQPNAARALRNLFDALNAKGPNVVPGEPVGPFQFLQALRHENRQFAEPGQHDAQECLVTILRFLATFFDGKAARSPPAGESGAVKEMNAIDQLFGLDMEQTDKCSETEETASRTEMVRSLMCYITQQVNSLNQGLVMEESIEKRSDALGRTAVWKRSSKIARLPPYLWVNFVRFFSSSSDPSRGRTKILRNVNFPLMLDLHDYCVDSLKEQTKEARENIRVRHDKTANTTKADMAAMDGVEAAASPDEQPSNKEAEPMTEGKSARYELTAVLTHKGRALDSGHYVGWVKHSDDIWLKFDDDKVSTCTPEEIQKLSGGGDWHMAYMILYKAINS